MLSGILPERDPRIKTWITLNNPAYITGLLGIYVCLVKRIGPALMQHRPPFNLKRVLVIYNIFQVAANLYYMLKISYLSFYVSRYHLWCERIHLEADNTNLELLDTLYQYLIVRILDFVDTIFFVLRKKFDHVSILHVLHHTLVVFNGWFYLQYGATGHPMFGVCMNAGVHVLMYTYYTIAALGAKQYLRWKRYLTKIQILQFFVGLSHALIPVLDKSCGYPRALIFLGIPQGLVILVLFFNFYRRCYLWPNGMPSLDINKNFDKNCRRKSHQYRCKVSDTIKKD